MIEKNPNPRPRVEITVVETLGSAPRDAGARMIWHPDGSFDGTIGGGNLEQKTLDAAAALWADPARSSALIEFPLSARLGQCCGGFVRVFLLKQLPPVRVVICGAGHVGAALAKALEGSPFEVAVADPRAEWAAPARFPASTRVAEEECEAFVREVAADAERVYLLIMTHSHQTDEDLCRLALRYPFAWIGLIGSRTKWMRFRKRLEARGFSKSELDRITCPIGDPALGRTPHEIAIGVAAQLLAIYHGKKAAPADLSAVASAEAEAPPGVRAALILAGGASSRMGRWKGGLPLEGETLVAAHARSLISAGADLWKAVYPEPEREEAERAIGPGHRVVNPTPTAPLFSSLQLGLAALIRERPDIDSLVMTPVDSVPLDEDWIAALWDRHETSGVWATQPAVAVEDDARPIRHGHPVILDRRLFAPILAADPATARLDHLIRDLPADRKATFDLPDARSLANLNTPEDYERARAD
jgi:xanthine dehydrogenase accessory factor